MTDPLDEQQLRRALRGAAATWDPSPGARERVLLAASAREAPPEVPEDDEDAGVAKPRRRHRVLLPLGAAAAVLLVTALVLSLTTQGPPVQPLGGHGLAGVSSPYSSTTIPSGFAAPLGLKRASPLEYGTITYGAAGVTQSTGQANQGAISNTTAAPPAIGTTPAKVVAVGAIAMRVPSPRLQTVLAQLTSLVRNDGGYVANSKVNAGSGGASSTASIVLRVPQHHFDALVIGAQKLGTPTSVVTNSADVTGEFVDYEARIAALEASRAQYLAILKRAGSIPDILAVQAQINNLQSEIEQLKGARNVLVNEAAYSTLTITLNPGQSTSAAASGLATAWHDSIGGFVRGFEWLVRAAGPAIFALLCLLVLLVLGRLGWRAARRRML
ncbi:MAG TPA: DUF4349 domain-containing protein [Acidimicrobiales bacterium]|jgi:hypothetical protein|nr:DUF4349 domain-containing protein [Acidimicrobiales bacterium]